MELSPDGASDRSGRADKVFEDAIDRILVEDPDISIGQDIALQRFQLRTGLVRDVSNREVPEIGEPQHRSLFE
jgi:hypothetical protein